RWNKARGRFADLKRTWLLVCTSWEHRCRPNTLDGYRHSRMRRKIIATLGEMARTHHTRSCAPTTTEPLSSQCRCSFRKYGGYRAVVGPPPPLLPGHEPCFDELFHVVRHCGLREADGLGEIAYAHLCICAGGN